MFDARHKFFLLLALSLIWTRVLPHPPNFTATNAAILTVAVISASAMGFIYLLVSYWLADLYINNFIYKTAGGFTLFTEGFHWIALLFAIQFLLNRKFFAPVFKPITILPAITTNAMIFHLVTNALVWYGSPRFSQDIWGLLQSYYDGIPFLLNDLLGGICYSVIFFGIFWMFNPEIKLSPNPVKS